MRFAIYGSGGFAREVAPLAREYLQRGAAAQAAGAAPEIVFVEDNEDRPAQTNGYPVIAFDELVSADHRGRDVIVAIGDGRARAKIEAKCREAGLTICSLHAPTVRILDDVELGAGAVLCDGVKLTSNIRIGKGFQANLSSYVGHDCVIGDYVTFAPQVCCNGNVHIEDFAYVGTGAKIIQGKSGSPMIIGEGALVGMGAVVTKPVEPYTVVAGNPARAIRTLRKPS